MPSAFLLFVKVKVVAFVIGNDRFYLMEVF